MWGGVGWLVLVVIGLAGSQGVGSPAVAQNASRQPTEQGVLRGIEQQTDEANRRAAEARRRQEEARQGTACSRALTAWLNDPRAVIPPSLQERDLTASNACRTAERYGVPFERVPRSAR